MLRPAVRIVNDSVTESVDLLQMLIAPPPPPPPPPQPPTTSRPATAAAAQPSLVDDTSAAAATLRPHGSVPPLAAGCRACQACVDEQRYRQRQQQLQQTECPYCPRSGPRAVDPRPQRPECEETTATATTIYFSPRGPAPPGSGCSWPRRPAQQPVHSHGSSLPPPVGAAAASGRRAEDNDDDNDDYDDAGKRTMSTSLSSRASSRTPRLRNTAADICYRARRAAAVADCCLRCWPRRRTDTDTADSTATAGDLLRCNATLTDIDLCVQPTHGAGHSESVHTGGASAGKGRKSSNRRGLRCATKWSTNEDRRRTIMLVVGFLVGLFLVSTALLAGFVLLWPSQRRRHSASGTVLSSVSC